MFLRNLLIFVILVAGLAASALASGSDLVISGSVTDVKISGPTKRVQINPNNVWEGFRFERTETYFRVEMRLTYCNKGDEALIVPLRQAFPSERTKLVFLDVPSPNGAAVANIDAMSNGFTRAFPERLLAALNAGTPPATFQVIEPTRCYESFDFVQVDTGFDIVVTKRRINQPDIEEARPKHPYFKLQYSYSLPDSLPVAEAKKRWRKLGKLVTRSDSDFFFETGVIINQVSN